MQQTEQKRKEVDRQLQERERQLARNKAGVPTDQGSPASLLRTTMTTTRVPNRLDEEEPTTFGGGGLNRSYSSPNIAKVCTAVARKWDRTLNTDTDPNTGKDRRSSIFRYSS